MGDGRIDNFRKKKEIVEKQRDLISDTLKIKQENIEKEAKTIGELKQCENHYSLFYSFLDDIPEGTVLELSDESYLTLTSGIEDPMISCEVVTDIWSQSKQAGTHYDEHYNMCASLVTVCSSGASTYGIIAENNPGWFPHKDEINSKYKVVDKLYEQIDTINNYLKSDLPEVAGDFDAFVDKYHAFKADSSQYQDLIGSRSMFFFKMILAFSKHNYGVDSPWKAVIECFVFGTATPVSNAQHIINSCYNLYNKLSTQDDDVQSIKLGNVTPDYVEAMFRRLIGNIAALLELRAKYFQ